MISQKEIDRRYPPLRRRVLALDDWYPCGPLHTVRVTLKALWNPTGIGSPYYVKFQAWGDDDFGLEREIEIESESGIAEIYKKCRREYNRIPPIITKSYFYARGFEPF